MHYNEDKQSSFWRFSEKIITRFREHRLQLLSSITSYTLDSFMGGMNYNKGMEEERYELARC
jgi:hypothetical protein